MAKTSADLASFPSPLTLSSLFLSLLFKLLEHQVVTHSMNLRVSRVCFPEDFLSVLP
jgi:hypothetical protein